MPPKVNYLETVAATAPTTGLAGELRETKNQKVWGILFSALPPGNGGVGYPRN